MIIDFLSLISLILLGMYFSLLFMQVKNHYRNKYYIIVIFAQLSFLYLFLSFIILYSLPQQFHFFFVDAATFLAILTKSGLISGIIGILLWLVLMEQLEFESTLVLNNIFFKRFMYVLLGLNIGYFILDSSSVWNVDHYSIQFTDPNVQSLLIVTFTLFVIQLVIFFIKRIYQFRNLKINSVTKQTLTPKYIELYIIPIILAFITGLLYVFNFFGNSTFGWLLISIPAEIIFSYLIFKIPLLFLSTEQPISLVVLAQSGTTVYSKKFTSTVTFSDQLLGAYLSAVDILGSNVIVDSGSVNSIKFQEKYNVSIKSIPFHNSSVKLCYIYKGISFYSDHRLSKFISLVQENQFVLNKIQDTITTKQVLTPFAELDTLANRCFSFNSSLN